jgi:hypothetical protein
MLFSIPAIAYGLLHVYVLTNLRSWELPEKYLYYFMGGLALIPLAIILSINTLSFVNSQRTVRLKFNFKKDFFKYVQTQIPEIKKYLFNHKIHPKHFYASGLFNSLHSDYIGDDLFFGEYQGTVFEICELHVFNLFKPVFDGLFIRIIGTSLRYDPNTLIKAVINQKKIPEDRHHIKINFSANTDIYLAVKCRGKFFESDTIHEIQKLEVEMELLSDLVTLVKEIIKPISSCK